MSWRDSVNQTVGSARIADITRCVRPVIPQYVAPIDRFYLTSQDLLKVGTPTLLSQHPSMGPLLLVGVVSTTENYFRDLFSQIIRICPLARAASADQPVKLGSVVWHGSLDAERGAFEHISFADSANIIKYSPKFIGYNIKRTSIIDEFDKVCELRHSIVHSSSYIAGKNAISLHLGNSISRLEVNIEFAQLQECADVCTTLVANTNKELWTEMARRWAVEWPKRPSWDPTLKHSRFRDLRAMFYSHRDALNRAIPAELTTIRCRNAVSKEFS